MELVLLVFSVKDRLEKETVYPDRTQPPVLQKDFD
jgi:hypothetical protein